MQICLIWAEGHDRVIGVKNTLPWRLPEDLAHFKALTAGHPVVMGRNTWDSLPRKPLPGRTNIVLTSRPDEVTRAGGVAAPSLASAIAAAAAQAALRCFVIGGARVYSEALAFADRVFITQVDAAVPGADTFAPALPASWRAESRSNELVSSSGLTYRFEEWARRPDLQDGS